MSTRVPDRYETSVLDSITGPIGTHVRVVPLKSSDLNYEGELTARILNADRTLDVLVIDLKAVAGTLIEGDPIPTSIRWAAVEAVLQLPTPEETPS